MTIRSADQGDNLLGVCATVAEVTGLPVLAVRLAFVIGLFVSLKLTLLAYGVAAVAVHAASRPLRLPRAFPRLRRS